jgi:hypothetical protein
MLNAVVCSRIRDLRETISAGTIALEISSRNARVAGAPKVLGTAAYRPGSDPRPAGDMADLPGGASGLLCRDYKGRRADRLATRIDPGVVLLLADPRGHERQAAEESGQWKTRVEERKPLDPSQADHARPLNAVVCSRVHELQEDRAPRFLHLQPPSPGSPTSHRSAGLRDILPRIIIRAGGNLEDNGGLGGRGRARIWDCSGQRDGSCRDGTSGGCAELWLSCVAA